MSPATTPAAEASARPRVTLVLGAGGARGLAHIGAIAAVEARGLQVSAVIGCSMGAVIGGIYAAGRLGPYRDWVTGLGRADVLRLLDFGFGVPGLIKGVRIVEALRERVGDHRIEDLPIPFVAVATDLDRQREVWLTRGPLFDAVRASMSIPLIFTPHTVEGRRLVDGGLLAPVPIAATRLVSADLVIAVDVNARTAVLPRRGPPQPAPVVDDGEEVLDEAGYRDRVAAWLGGLFERKPGAPAQPGLLDLMGEALDTMQGQIARMQLAQDPPDVLVRVPHDAALFYEFWRARELVDRGYALTEAALREAGF